MVAQDVRNFGRARDIFKTPDLVAIQVYITSAYRAYELADHYRKKGAHVALGGLHVTSLPGEAARHADTIFIGPGENREVRNETNQVATMLVVMPYPPA